MLECNKPNMLKLIESLESGEFSQDSGQLKSVSGYCCLGVACEIHRGAQENVKHWDGVKDNQDNHFRYLNSRLYMPDEVTNWLGIDFCRGDVPIDSTKFEAKQIIIDKGIPTDSRTTAALMNDHNVSFTNIALCLRESYGLEDA